MKTIIKQFFIALQQISMTSYSYIDKYTNFKSQELIGTLFEKWKNIKQS